MPYCLTDLKMNNSYKIHGILLSLGKWWLLFLLVQLYYCSLFGQQKLSKYKCSRNIAFFTGRWLGALWDFSSSPSRKSYGLSFCWLQASCAGGQGGCGGFWPLLGIESEGVEFLAPVILFNCFEDLPDCFLKKLQLFTFPPAMCESSNSSIF